MDTDKDNDRGTAKKCLAFALWDGENESVKQEESGFQRTEQMIRVERKACQLWWWRP
jgi:hypothetical protein